MHGIDQHGNARRVRNTTPYVADRLRRCFEDGGDCKPSSSSADLPEVLATGASSSMLASAGAAALRLRCGLCS
jgi:hypothetical protein